MTATWPTNVNTVQYETIRLTTQDQRTLWGHEHGNPMAEALATASQVLVSFNVRFNGAEYSAFQTWFEGPCALGAMDFTGLEGVVSDGPSRYKFEQLPEFVMLRGAADPADRLWHGTFNLRRLGGG